MKVIPGVIFGCEEDGLVTIDCCDRNDFDELKEGTAARFEIGFVAGRIRTERHISLCAKDIIEIRDFLSSVIDGTMSK